MGHGGARVGAGKKKGTVNKKTVALRETATKKIAELAPGELPLDVMVENMLFWQRTSKLLAEKIMELGKTLQDGDERTEFLKLLQKFLHAREQAQACAVDAAPYYHAKLASISIKGDVNATVKHVLGTMSPREAMEAYETMLKGTEIK